MNRIRHCQGQIWSYPPYPNHIQTFKDLLHIARVKIDEELDTITLNKYSTGYDVRDDQHRGHGLIRREGKGGGNNVQINRAGFNNSSQGEKSGNNQSNNRNQNKKRNRDFSPDDDFPTNIKP